MSKWAAICSIAAKFGCNAETLRLWVRPAGRTATPGATSLDTDIAERLMTLG